MKIINSNGSKWAGDAPDSIEVLLERLAKEPLDPYWGPCVYRARNSRAIQNDTGQTEYIDMGPMFPEFPNTFRFFGNFLNMSAVFSIDTDEPDLIDKLTAAIQENQARPDYIAAKAVAA